jgi:phosphoribosylformylglycinamidine cyclo-ligase
MGKLVLSPTRTYAPVIRKLIDEIGKNIHGMIHCSGGAQTKILHFINDLHIIKDNLLQIPPLFEIIQKESNTDWREMYKVFNMGHRMEFYLPESFADKVIDISRSFGIDAQVIGRVETSAKGKHLTISTENGTFLYS